MKSIILASFSESLEKNPLPFVKEEHRALHDAYNKKWHKHVRLVDQKDFKPSWVLKNLSDHGKHIRVFYFSGHSNDNVLKFYKGDGSKKALVPMLNTLAKDNKLQCVVLNGCSNLEFAKALVDVPVVIGTSSPIVDQAGAEFGVSFFENLITNKTSYQGAFTMARGQALNNSDTDQLDTFITRDYLGDETGNEEEKKNEWVCIEREKGLAASLKFDFASRIPKWLWALIALLFGFLFYLFVLPYIMFAIRGYVAPDFRKGEECKILVEDFLGTDVTHFNDLLVLGIKENEIFNQNVQALAIDDYDKLIYNLNKVDPNDLPGLANYNYNLYGDIAPKEDGGTYKINFKVYPKQGTSSTAASKVYLDVLEDIDNLASDIDSAQANLKLVSQICLTCAYENKKMVAVAGRAVDAYAESSPEDAQKSYMVLGETSRRHEMNKESAGFFQKAFSPSMPDTDVAVAALQASVVYETEDRKFAMAYMHQSQVVSRMESRKMSPANFKMNKSAAFYEDLGLKYRLKRSENVLSNIDNFGIAKEKRDQLILASINDYQYLQSLGIYPSNFDSEIKELYKKLEEVAVDRDEDGFTNQDGDCDDANSKIYPGAEEICGNEIDDNCNGEIDEGCETEVPPPPPPPDNEEEQDEIFEIVEEMPRFNDKKCEDFSNTKKRAKCAQGAAIRYISKHLKYPAIAIANKVEGTCVVQFVVDEKGNLTNAKLTKDIGAQCGQEALRIVKSMPTWVPGRQRGTAVKVHQELQIQFKLPEVEEEILQFAEEMPRFGNDKCEALSDAKKRGVCAEKALLRHINKHLKYPAIAIENQVEGTCIIQFVVDKKGNLKDPIIERDIGAQCGQEALRIVQGMPAWVPGRHRGQLVNVEYSLPIKFKLPEVTPPAKTKYKIYGTINDCADRGLDGLNNVMLNGKVAGTFSPNTNMYSLAYEGSPGDVLKIGLSGGYQFVNPKEAKLTLDETTTIKRHFNVEKTLQSYQVFGRVVGPKGEPLLGVNVIAKGTTYGATTDMEGNFRFTAKNVKICTWKVVVSSPGYTTQEQVFVEYYEPGSEGILFPDFKMAFKPK